MKETIKLALILFLFGAVSAGVLALANDTTSVIINERKAQALTDSLSVVFPDADAFEEADAAEVEKIKEGDSNVLQIYNASKGGEVVGNVLEMTSSGYGGPFKFIVGIDSAEKAITGFKMMEHSESPGFGSKAEEPAFEQGTVGAKSGEEIQGISGATVSTVAIQKGLDSAFNAVGVLSGEVVQQSPEEKLNASLAAAYPDADSFEAAEAAGADGSVQSVHKAMKGGESVGSVVVVKAEGGYAGEITFALGVDSAGAITGFAPIEHGETPGFGANMEEPDFAASLVGKTDANIDGISGATVTTNALKTGIEKALEAAKAVQ